MKLSILQRHIILLLSCFLSVTYNFAQEHDGGFLIGAEVYKELNNSWQVYLKEELRLKGCGSEFDQFASKLNADYSFFQKRFKVGASFYYTIKNSGEKALIYNRFRGNLNFSYSEQIKNFKIELRTRWQNTFFTAIEDKPRNPEMYLRHRLQLSYKLAEKPVEFQLSTEAFQRLNHPDRNIIDKFRTIFGVEYSITPKHELYFYVRADNDVFVKNRNNIYYLGAVYRFKH